MGEPFRVRMVLDDRNMLSKPQRSEGLQRTWLLLSPEIPTISDLESNVRMAFDLNCSCPNGIVLSMYDDFVLPPFESASILKDRDIIRVRKKDMKRMDAINLGDDPHYIQDSGLLEKQHIVSCDTRHAITEFGEDSGRKRKHVKDLSAHDETAICIGTTSKSKNKRNHSDEIHGSKNVQAEENIGGNTSKPHMTDSLTKESLHWNGTTSKRNGQKWGQENATSNWNDANGFTHQYHGNARKQWNNANGYAWQQWARENTVSKWNNAENYKEQCNGQEKFVSKLTDANGEDQCNRMTVSEKGKTGSRHPNFESLFPLTRIPQVGDWLAYRLIEFSSSWCLEVSPYRVGEVTSYNYLSLSIILVPVPEYPIISDEEMERRDSMLQANSSPYNEDGSLQIHYPSLLDVRLLKDSESEVTASDHSGGETSVQEEAHVNNWELAVNNCNAGYSGPEMSTQETPRVNSWEKSAVNSSARGTVAQPTESGNASGSTWDQIKQALNKEAARRQSCRRRGGWDDWTPSKSAAGTSWSYTELRRSGVGPTLVYLRGSEK